MALAAKLKKESRLACNKLRHIVIKIHMRIKLGSLAYCKVIYHDRIVRYKSGLH